MNTSREERISRVAYFDCFAGISGDMTIAALLDAGAPLDALEDVLAALPIEKPQLKVETVHSHGLRGTRLTVVEPASPLEHRTYRAIEDIVSHAPMAPRALKRAHRILYRLAAAEAHVHGVPIDDVHFHEIGALDTIVDVVGVAVLLEALGVDEVICSPVPTGSGEITTEHGILPVPAPATAELLKGVPLAKRDIEGEAVTPTGAAIVRALANRFGAPANMAIDAIGYGFGHRTTNIPNFFRVMIGTPVRPEQLVYEVRANLDDVNPKLIPEAIKHLLTAGALDAWAESILMKKGRPGFTVAFLAPVDKLDALVEIVFRDLPTIGVRYSEVARRVLERREISVPTQFGDVTVKVAGKGTERTVIPEFDECVALAEQFGLPVSHVIRQAEHEAALRLARETEAAKREEDEPTQK